MARLLARRRRARARRAARRVRAVQRAHRDTARQRRTAARARRGARPHPHARARAAGEPGARHRGGGTHPHVVPGHVSCFTLEATDGAARAGTLHTAHGDVPTPAFMPVGTKATVKTVDPVELRAVGTTILLANTYHLHFRPGEDVVAELGGLHRFMGWDGPILTDSGGFQVFSLRDTIARVDDDGVTFRSVYDGAPARLTPELVAAIQASLGSDVAMCLDICPPVDVGRAALAEAVPCPNI